jgi:cyclin A
MHANELKLKPKLDFM